jgi:hypothetical protein
MKGADVARRLDLDAQALDWGSVKLVPSETGLPMTVWITENAGYVHDVRVKVSPVHGGRGAWPGAPSVGVRPVPHEIVAGSLPAADVALVRQWIDLNRDAIVEFWDGAITVTEVLARLRVL